MGGRRGYTGRQGVWGRKEGLHRPSGGLGTERGAIQAVRGSGDEKRGYTGRQGVWERKEGLHRPSGGLGTERGTTQAVRGSGDGKRGYTGRQGVWGRKEGLHRPSGGVGAGGAVPGAMGCTNNIYFFIKDDVKLSMFLKSKVMLLKEI